MAGRCANSPGPAQEGLAPMHRDSTHGSTRDGSLLRRENADGSESWYGKWREGGRQVMRVLGPVRRGRRAGGLTKSEAEAALRNIVTDPATATGGPTLAEAGRRYLAHKQSLGLKPGTLSDYESALRVHLVPFFGSLGLAEVTVPLVEEFIYEKQREGKAPKSILNYLGLLHAIFGHGVKREWCARNPVALVDKPRVPRNVDIRFLSLEELEAILRATPTTPLGRTDRLIFLTAAMTGLRRGEVVALRWQDVDWKAALIRVRRSFTRGEFGTPKSRRSSRAVPLAPRLLSELRSHWERTPYRGASELVFPHPASGHVLDPSKLRKRFKASAGRAGVRPVRFHDLRHTFGTQMAAAGAPLRAIQEWLGHSDFRTTLIYADYALDPHQGALYAERAFSGEPSGSALSR
jgi:integrase